MELQNKQRLLTFRQETNGHTLVMLFIVYFANTNGWSHLKAKRISFIWDGCLIHFARGYDPNHYFWLRRVVLCVILTATDLSPSPALCDSSGNSGSCLVVLRSAGELVNGDAHVMGKGKIYSNCPQESHSDRTSAERSGFQTEHILSRKQARHSQSKGLETDRKPFIKLKSSD